MFSRLLSVCDMWWVLWEIDEFPSWYRSMRFRDMGSRNGGWLLVVGFLCLGVGSGFVMFPICGRSRIRALWSPYSGMWVVIIVFVLVYMGLLGCRSSQWSRDVFAGIYVCRLVGVM